MPMPLFFKLDHPVCARILRIPNFPKTRGLACGLRELVPRGVSGSLLMVSQWILFCGDPGRCWIVGPNPKIFADGFEGRQLVE